MNKVIVLAFLCTFSCSLNIFSMEDRELLRQTTGKLFYNSESYESDSPQEDQESHDECTSSSALVAMNSEEMLKDLSCFYCYASLMNSSFMYSDLLDRYVCTDCARYYWSEEESDGITFQHSEDDIVNQLILRRYQFSSSDNQIILEDYTYEFYQLLELSSDNKEVKQSKCILALKEFVEDEPLFDHKKENTRTHKINQRHQLKKSKQHWLKKQATCLSAPAKKQLRTLHKKANSIFSCK